MLLLVMGSPCVPAQRKVSPLKGLRSRVMASPRTAVGKRMGSSTARKSPPKRAEFIRQGAGTESASAATLVRDYGKAEARSSRSSTRRPTGRHGAAPIRGSASRAISRAGSGFIRGRAPAPFAEAAITEPGGAERLGIAPGILAPITAGRLVAPLKHFAGLFLCGQQETPEQPLEVPSDHRGGSRGRPRHHRSAPRTLDEALRLPGRLRARENGVYWRREGRDRGQKGAAHCGPVPGVDPRGGSTAQGRTPALRKAARWMIERARTGLCRSRKGHYGTEIGPV